MREALGYARWNLWGGSYGTRVAQEYLRRHPDRVRTLILDGVAPPGMIITLDVWRTREAALAAIFAQCAASERCRATHPDLATTLARLRASLGPEGRELDLQDPAHRRLAAGAGVVRPGPLRAAAAHLRARNREPAARDAVARDRRRIRCALRRASRGLRQPRRTDERGAALFRDLRRRRPAHRAGPGSAGAGGTAHRPPRAAAHRRVRRVAARHDAGGLRAAGLRQRSGAAAFRRHGSGHASRQRRRWSPRASPNSRHIVAPGYGHIVSVHACGPRLLAAFVDQAGFGKLPATCVDHFEKSTPPPVWAGRLAP